MLVYNLHSYILVPFYFTNVVLATLVNITVDDSHPDPETGELINYTGNGWNVGQTCNGCSVKLNKNKMYMETWHDSTYYPANNSLDRSVNSGPLNATFKFTGSAIYVFCVTPSSGFYPTNMTFYIDGDLVGKYAPFEAQGYNYNVSVYSNNSLPHGLHEFVLENGQVGGGGNLSLILFDYLIYSYDSELDVSNTITTSVSVLTLPPTTSTTSVSALTLPPTTGTTSVSILILPPTTVTVISSSSASTSVQPSGSIKIKQRGVIIGAAVGAVCGIAVIILVVLFLLRHRKAGIQVNGIQPFTVQSSRHRPFLLYGGKGDDSLIPNIPANEPGTSFQHDGPGLHPPGYDQIY